MNQKTITYRRYGRKNVKNYWSTDQWSSQPENFRGGKLFDTKRITLFSLQKIFLWRLQKRLSKHKMTIFFKNLGGIFLPTRTKTSEQGYNDLMASSRRSSTPFSRNTPLSFSRVTRWYAFSRSTKHVKMSLAYSEGLSKFCWWVKCGL